MCGGGSPPEPEPMLPSPTLKTPAPVRDIPTPERIKEEEDPDIITGKKRKKLKVDTIRKGTKVFDAIDPSMNTGSPEQGIPNIK
mgnify:CR=1 FL=1|tara:strand:+ start:148 stop:399 length:252 start_codon:yes stop_codon:yes gene_type:complete